MLLTQTRRFRTAAWGQNFIDVLFGFARRAARMPQKDVRMEEVMAAIGPERASVWRKGCISSSTIHLLWRVRVWGQSTNEACGNFVNNGLPPAVFCRGDNQLGMNCACRNVICVTLRIGRIASQRPKKPSSISGSCEGPMKLKPAMTSRDLSA
jgi:hypothetical protein